MFENISAAYWYRYASQIGSKVCKCVGSKVFCISTKRERERELHATKRSVVQQSEIINCRCVVPEQTKC
jgi:hypothetical protein